MIAAVLLMLQWSQPYTYADLPTEEAIPSIYWNTLVEEDAP